MKALICILCALALSSLALCQQCETRYVLSAIAVPAGMEVWALSDVNTNNMIVGHGRVPGDPIGANRPVVWSNGTTILPLPDASNHETGIIRMNSSGWLTGVSYNSNNGTVSTWLYRQGKYERYKDGVYIGMINNSGNAPGRIATGNGTIGGVWDAWLGFTPMQEGSRAVPLLISEKNEVFGSVDDENGVRHAARWNRSWEPATTLREDLPGSRYLSLAADGSLAGNYYDQDGSRQVFIERGGQTLFLPDTAGRSITPIGLGNNGTLVAMDYTNFRGLVWQGGGWLDPDTLLTNNSGGRYSMRTLGAINNEGTELYGMAMDWHTGNYVPVRLTAVPEPATLGALALGAGLLLRRRRR